MTGFRKFCWQSIQFRSRMKPKLLRDWFTRQVQLKCAAKKPKTTDCNTSRNRKFPWHGTHMDLGSDLSHSDIDRDPRNSFLANRFTEWTDDFGCTVKVLWSFQQVPTEHSPKVSVATRCPSIFLPVFGFIVWLGQWMCLLSEDLCTNLLGSDEETPGYRWSSSKHTVQSERNAEKRSVSARYKMCYVPAFQHWLEALLGGSLHMQSFAVKPKVFGKLEDSKHTRQWCPTNRFLVEDVLVSSSWGRSILPTCWCS